MGATSPGILAARALAVIGLVVIATGTVAAQDTATVAPIPNTQASPFFGSLHGQSTLVSQSALPFHAPYKGDNSLDNGGLTKETWTVTPAIGVRLGFGRELYFDPELFQGFGLSGTHGAAGFTNGEAQKGGSALPKVSVARLFYRETFGFGGETEQVKDDFNQLGGTRDVSRLTMTFGKLAVTDIFDDNSYAHDPRTGFMNWSIWEAGGFDYAADQKGYTWGVAFDLNQKDWAFRTGYFLVPEKSNAQQLDLNLFERGQYLAEVETRYNFMSQPGKLRALGWLGQNFSGSYRQAVALSQQDGTDPNTTIEQTRKTRTRYGFVLGAEQAINDSLGVFARLSWAEGSSEILSFTDIDQSVSFGLSLKGDRWGRPNDTFGLAGAINGISSAHRDFIAAGGLGLVIGDGRLNYSVERILETFYSVSLRDPVSLTFDYQFIENPAYNADRGPVSVFSTRLHGQF